MVKPPTDADPEKFIIGRGGYNNLQTWQPYHDEHVFRIDPAPMSVGFIIGHNILFAVFFIGIYWLITHDPHPMADPWGPFYVLGIGLFTGVGFTSLVYYYFDKERRLGPWLVYEKATRRVALPREGKIFERQEIIHLQSITTKPLDRSDEQLSELNLITYRDGERKRWPLLRSNWSEGMFDNVLKPLIDHTDLPVMQVTDSWLGWQITEKPYGQPAKKWFFWT